MPSRTVRQFIFGMIIGCVIFVPAFAFAQNKLDLNSSGAILSDVAKPTGLSQENLSTQSGALIQRILAVTGIVFFVLAVYAGITWMLAQGNETQAEKAKNTLIGAVLGLIIVIAAYSVTNLILTRLNTTIQGGESGNPSIGDGPPGCCLDRVNAGWACRITTESDCVQRGKLCEAGDDFCGNADYEFRGGITEVPACVAVCDAR